MRTCGCSLGCFLLACLVLYLVSPFLFQPLLMSNSVLNERFRPNPLCNFRLGTVVTSDYETHLTNVAEWSQAPFQEHIYEHIVEQTVALVVPTGDG